jgi:hypothetical protein
MPAPWQSPDLDEFRPNRFIVNNEKVRPFLRGEGVREGVYFLLQNWRREGWVARLRAAGFNVRTLSDRVEALREIRRDLTRGPEGLRRLTAARERIATWDPQRLRWRDQPIETVDGTPTVRLCVNEPVRRRKGRAGGDYFIAIEEGTGRIGFKPVKETDAIVQAYGLLAAAGHPATLRFTMTGEDSHIPSDQALLPEPHREALERLSLDAPPWTFSPEQLPFAKRVFEKLAIELRSME